MYSLYNQLTHIDVTLLGLLLQILYMPLCVAHESPEYSMCDECCDGQLPDFSQQMALCCSHDSFGQLLIIIAYFVIIYVFK